MKDPGLLARALTAGLIALALPALVVAQTDDDCLGCHGDPGLKAAGGRSLFVDKTLAGASIHGRAGLACVGCHADLAKVQDFPHAEKLAPAACASCHAEAEAKVRTSVHGTAAAGSTTPPPSCQDCHGTHDIRAVADPAAKVFHLNLPATCGACHFEKVKTARGNGFVSGYMESVHYRALVKAGLSVSADCANCHGGHDVRKVADPGAKTARGAIIATCGACHSGIEQVYREGVHGQAYAKGIGDVPVCTDCHAEHDIQPVGDLKSLVYATKVAAVCTRCHDDAELAGKYGLPASRLKSYTRSFHGTASSFGESRVANCASCHGFHDVRPPTDPKSSVHPANLAGTCGTCHPGAGVNFTKGKVHIVDERKDNAAAFFIKLFYTIMIAVLISGFLVYIAADLYRRRRDR